jgi:predicted transcriptional regulator
MKPRDLPTPNASELAVLKALWGGQSQSARELHERLTERLAWSYSTTRTVLERMVHKGLLSKRSSHGIYLYAPAISKAAGLAGLVRDFAERVLETSHEPVVSLFARSGVLSAEEIEDLSRLLEDDSTGKGP